MKDYHSYTTDDFVQDLYFSAWVMGTLPAQDDFWPTWLANHPEQWEVVEQAKLIILSLCVEDIPIDHLGVPEAIDRILAARYSIRPLPVYRRTWFRVAASIVLVCGIGFGLWRQFVSGTLSRTESIAKTSTPADERRLLTLPDGSTVMLEPNSQLQVSVDFNRTRREVTLVGAGFFEVTKDPSRPFLVNTGKIVTRVVGTSFGINAYNIDSSISVSVRTGKVTVFRKEKGGRTTSASADEVVLTPNQQAVFMTTDEQFIKTLVDEPVIVSATSQRKSFDFNETPVPQVLKAVSEAYGVTMVYDADVLANCNLTASLNKQDLYQKLDLICEAIHASYKVTDGQIILAGTGCN